MTKILYSEDEARKKLLAGVDAVSNHVKETLGPKGRNIIIEQPYSAPKSTKDGVTVARSITLEDPAENLGAQLTIQAAEKTVDQAGDGTTATCVLLQAIVTAANRNITAGANPIDIKRGIEYAAGEVVKNLIAMKIDVSLKDEARLTQVATIAANGDEKLGKLIAEAMIAVGPEGITTVEESNSVDTEVEKPVSGMQFNNGFISAYFMTDGERRECVLEDPYILLYDKKITEIKVVAPILEILAKAGKPFLIIAEDVDGPALATILMNSKTVVRPDGRQGGFSVCAVKGPAFGSRRRDNMTDIAILTGGTLISEETGQKLENATLGMLGTAKKVIVTEENTTIIGGAGTEAAVERRREEIRSRMEKAEQAYDKEKQQERLAKLSSGVATVRVGGRTEVQMKETRDRVEDALMAAKSAVQEGIVPGGGMALMRSGFRINHDTTTDNSDYYNGVDIVRNACKEPFRQIITNAGLEHAEIWANIKSISVDNTCGYDAASGKIVDMLDKGIIDSVKVIRCALENAVSVAGQIILCQGTVHDKREQLQVVNNNPDEM